MRLSTAELARLLLAVALLLTAAHGCGYLFARYRQPRVIGEILGGLLLGPTVLGALAPEVQAAIFPADGPVPVVLDAVYQLGLLLLMFAAGAEIRSLFTPRERRTVSLVAVTGTAIPFVAGLLFLLPVDQEGHYGPAATDASFVMVFGIAVAVTSIPVISRIMHDLGILDTTFARIVLAIAVVEDVLLYVLLAIALGLVARAPSDLFGLPSALGLDPGSAADVAVHVVATLGVLALALLLGPPVYRRVLRFRFNIVKRGSPIAFQLVFMLAITVGAVALGVVPLFGAFVAGVVVGSTEGEGAARARESIRDFSFAFFIPAYFAIVGLRLDLLNDFEPLFFVAFVAFACAAKALSVYAGARLAREDRRSSVNLAVALNARGGPGIVLASVALDAGIVDPGFYAILVLLAVLTSLAAGSWLEREVRSGRPLRSPSAV